MKDEGGRRKEEGGSVRVFSPFAVRRSPFAFRLYAEGGGGAVTLNEARCASRSVNLLRLG
jgi:hypothetical protein